MNPVVHFELPTEDKVRMGKFYSQAFGWKTKMLGPDMGDYVLVTTAESDESGHPKKPGMINGGFFKKTNDLPSPHPSVVIAVDDIHEAMNKVTAAGGKVLGDPMEILGYGQYVSFYDTEGNRVSMIEPNERNRSN